jgi:SSS family solute:Na+ symporter
MIGLSLTTAFTVVFLFTVYAPRLCRRSSAFYTGVAGIAVVAAWLIFDELEMFVHPIYLEWPVCLAAFLAVTVIDRRRIPAGK